MADVIRLCTDQDLEAILEVINDAAQAYKGTIPSDWFKDPYMPREELKHEIERGVRFWGFEQDGQLLGVMGLQDVEDVTLIRHAYVRTTHRRHGIGGRLLHDLRSRATRPLLVGTWAAAEWAIMFYRQHGFEMVPRNQVPLLRRYWSIPERQIETSVVLAEKAWLDRGWSRLPILKRTKPTSYHERRLDCRNLQIRRRLQARRLRRWSSLRGQGARAQFASRGSADLDGDRLHLVDGEAVLVQVVGEGLRRPAGVGRPGHEGEGARLSDLPRKLHCRQA
jgi:N-acetylglutamate synthase-like GNAT family acetyltransferase